MENASKALLIAAAILIVILLIAVGMRVFNSASDTIGAGTEQMGSQAVSMFNAQFESYIGPNVSGSNVRSLISAAKANSKTDKQVKVYNATFSKSGNTVTASKTNEIKLEDVVTSTHYYVQANYDSNGYINEVYVGGQPTTTPPTTTPPQNP